MSEVTDPYADLEGDVQLYEVPRPGGGTRTLRVEPIGDELTPRLRLETPDKERSLKPFEARCLADVYEPFFDPLGDDQGFVADLRTWARAHMDQPDLERVA